jgi:sugar diacid utilization regulator
MWGDLTNELLDSDGSERGRLHAQTLWYDIDRPHRAVIVQRAGSNAGSLTPAVRRALQRFDLDVPLMTTQAAGAVLLVAKELPWTALADAVAEENSETHRISVGSLRASDELWRSLAEAELALNLTRQIGGEASVTLFDDLGVWRLMASNGSPAELQDFVDEWIGRLIAHDRTRNSEFV